jgi:hypothetical protein
VLYKLAAKGEGLGTLEPLAFLEVADLLKKEKDLENLLADHLLDVLFEDAALQPIFQERSLQAEADVYVEFLPYRIYDIGGQRYFEFFSLPYDRHRDPATVKGVLFDTNRSWDEDAIWEMMEKRRVADYGDIKYVVEYLNPKDIVFFYHKWVGVVAAAEILPGPPKRDGDNEEYRNVKFLTPVPARGAKIRVVPAAQVSQVTGKTFFWARTIKVPYLGLEDTQKLLGELGRVLESQPAPNQGPAANAQR